MITALQFHFLLFVVESLIMTETGSQREVEKSNYSIYNKMICYWFWLTVRSNDSQRFFVFTFQTHYLHLFVLDLFIFNLGRVALRRECTIGPTFNCRNRLVLLLHGAHLRDVPFCNAMTFQLQRNFWFLFCGRTTIVSIRFDARFIDARIRVCRV